MREEDFDVYPIVHGGKAYTLVTPLDLTFAEVRLLLDWLDARQAFSPSGIDDQETGRIFTADLPGASYDVDVLGYEVVVYRRTPA
jgi:hypothetical protein